MVWPRGSNAWRRCFGINNRPVISSLQRPSGLRSISRAPSRHPLPFARYLLKRVLEHASSAKIAPEYY